MPTEHQAFWAWARPHLRRAYGYDDPTWPVLEAFLETCPDEELPASQITEILAALEASLRAEQEEG